MPNHFNLSLRTRTRGKWTPEKRALAENMMRDSSSNAEIAKAVGMSVSAVELLLNGCDRPKKKPTRKLPVVFSCAVERAPATVLEERERRKAAAEMRDYNSTFFGDPPPGYSALDQKRRAEA